MQDEQAVSAVAASKRQWRDRLRTVRRERSAQEILAARNAVCAHVLARWAEQGWTCVAAYVPLRTEPGSVELLDGLLGRGVRVIVPITLPDRDLDWAPWSSQGLGDALGTDAVAAASAVLVPACAVARDGTRLGRGGGSYDRALPRTRTGTPRVALLFDEEIVDSLPHDKWDAPVTAVVRPAGWTDL
ncbi:MAG: 5-formyltetrahydrofolate cyclo-ligase [Jatrophihabitans sp.]